MTKILASVTGSISFSQIGPQGPQGPAGPQGARGTKGALMREHDGFESGEYKYLSGSGAEAYIDVVYVNKKWWQCIVTYDKATSSPNLSDGHWKEMNNYKSIATHLLLAENATINMLGTNQINLFNPTDVVADSKMYGSFRVVDDIDKWSLWLGGETGDSAPFAVKRSGYMKASAGKIGSFTIKTSTDSTGFVFYGLYAKHEATPVMPWVVTAFDIDGFKVECGGNNNDVISDRVHVGIGWNGALVGEHASWYNGVIQIGGYLGAGADSDVVAIHTDITPKSGYRSYALLAHQGDVLLDNGAFIGALRPNVSTKSYSATLSENECYIVCTNTSAITLTLPTNPRKGQLYLLYQAGARIDISTSSSHLIIARGYGSAGRTTWYSDTQNQLSFLTCGEDGRWYVAYTTG